MFVIVFFFIIIIIVNTNIIINIIILVGWFEGVQREVMDSISKVTSNSGYHQCYSTDIELVTILFTNTDEYVCVLLKTLQCMALI